MIDTFHFAQIKTKACEEGREKKWLAFELAPKFIFYGDDNVDLPFNKIKKEIYVVRLY